MLTKRQAEVLRIMRDEGEELIYERGMGYVAYSPVAARTVFALLRLAAITLSQFSTVGVYECYTINETGRAALAALEVKDA